MMRNRRKFREQVAEEQFGFGEGKGKRNAIFVLRILAERALEMQNDLYLCFIDYTKAFDTIKHEHMIKISQDLNMDGKNLRVVQNLYWEQTAAIRYENELGKSVKIRRGVRQGCVLSPDLFPLYSDHIMREIEENSRNKSWRIQHQQEHLQHLLDIIDRESEKVGLQLNTKKKVTMVMSKKTEPPICRLNLKDSQWKEQVESFKYLGATITWDGRSTKEIQIRIAQAKSAFVKLSKILTNPSDFV